MKVLQQNSDTCTKKYVKHFTLNGVSSLYVYKYIYMIFFVGVPHCEKLLVSHLLQLIKSLLGI